MNQGDSDWMRALLALPLAIGMAASPALASTCRCAVAALIAAESGSLGGDKKPGSGILR